MTILRVRALIFQDDALLLCKVLKGPTMFFPGGQVEKGETLLEALHREVGEEAQGMVTEQEYLGAIEARWSLNGKPMHDLSHFFAVKCSGLSVSHTPKCNDPGVSIEWVPRAAINQMPIKPELLKPRIEAFLNGKREIWWDVIEERGW